MISAVANSRGSAAVEDASGGTSPSIHHWSAREQCFGNICGEFNVDVVLGDIFPISFAYAFAGHIGLPSRETSLYIAIPYLIIVPGVESVAAFKCSKRPGIGPSKRHRTCIAHPSPVRDETSIGRKSYDEDYARL
jgi:hypothetical protein